MCEVLRKFRQGNSSALLFYKHIKKSNDEKKTETKALKPSEMGLHSKVRCEITLKGKSRVAQADEIVRFTEEL